MTAPSPSEYGLCQLVQKSKTTPKPVNTSSSARANSLLRALRKEAVLRLSPEVKSSENISIKPLLEELMIMDSASSSTESPPSQNCDDVEKDFKFPIRSIIVSMEREKMKLIILEGCHGLGKTFIIKKLQDAGHRALVENFDKYMAYSKLKHPKYDIFQTLYFAQLGYIFHLEEKIEKAYHDGCEVMFLDRFFLSTLLYSFCYGNYISWKRKACRTDFSDGKILQRIVPIVQRLSQYCSFDYTIFRRQNHGGSDDLWDRILARAEKEPWRKNLLEGEYEWLHYINATYKILGREFISLIHSSANKPTVRYTEMTDETYQRFLVDFKK